MENIIQSKMSVFSHGYYNRFGKPVICNRPFMEATPEEVYKRITSITDKAVTERLRAETDEAKQRELKILSLDYITPNGTFTYRNKEGIKEESGYMVVDIDDVEDESVLVELRQKLIYDTRFETVLLFVSPRGHGLKWIIDKGDLKNKPHREFFQLVARHVAFNYGIDIDKSGKDMPRPCYLCYDPNCYISPKYKVNE